MKDEKMMILHMLEQGKISIDQASMLIEALEEAEAKDMEDNDFFNKIKDSNEPDTEESQSSHRKHERSQNWEKDLEDRMDKLGKKIESKFDKDFVEKMERKGEEIGEKMGRLGENIAEGTASLTDKILNMVENVVDKGTFVGMFSNSEPVAEKHVRDIINIANPELVFQGVNGKILIKTWDEDKIHVDAFCQVKKNTASPDNPIYSFYEDGNKLVFKPSYTHNLGTKLEIKIPKREYDKINLLTTNGRIHASDITSKYLVCNTTNSTVNLSDIESPEINVDTKNGRIILEDIKSNILVLSTANSTIHLNDVDCEDIKATTKNGKIIFDDVTSNTSLAKTSNASININDCDTIVLDTETSNAKININDIKTERLRDLYMKTSNSSIEASFSNLDKGLSIDAKTSMGHINVNIPGLIYDVNDQKHLGSKKILAHSESFNEESGIKVLASTSNASIQIGK